MTEKPETINARIARVMGQIDRIAKTAKNPHDGYDYASGDDVYDALRPLMAAEGISLEHRIEPFDALTVGTVTIPILPVTMWITDGESSTAAATWPIPLNIQTRNGVRFTPQNVGAALTYAHKYFLRAMFSLSTGEADADAASPEAIPDKPAPARRNAAPKPAPQEAEAVAPGPEPTGDLPQIEVRPDGSIITTNGETLGSAAATHDRPFQAEAFKLLKDILGNSAFSQDRLDLLTKNADEFAAAIPIMGRTSLKGMMDAAQVPDDLRAKLLHDPSAGNDAGQS